MPGNLVDRCFVPACAIRLFGGAYTILAFPAKELFYDAVFQRVEGDHRQPAAPDEGFHRLGEGSFQRAQLIVDGDTEGLKTASGGVDAPRFVSG